MYADTNRSESEIQADLDKEQASFERMLTRLDGKRIRYGSMEDNMLMGIARREEQYWQELQSAKTIRTLCIGEGR